MDDYITSASNTIIKKAKRLQMKKYRELDNQYLMEGIRAIEAIILKKCLPSKVFYTEKSCDDSRCSELMAILQREKVPCIRVTDQIINLLSETENTQGFIAVMDIMKHEMKDIVNQKGLILILDRIQDPGNLGTIIRTADAVGASGAILPKGGADPYNSKAIRASVGSIVSFPLVTKVDVIDSIAYMKKIGYSIVTAEMCGSVPFYTACLKYPIALIVGNEAYGIAKEIIKISDSSIHIPMVNQVESLNVAIASGVLLYEIYRQNVSE
jgi:TrmH family RNA methyltransferase